MMAMFAVCFSLSILALPPKRGGLKPVPGYDWMAPRKRAPGKPAPPPVPAEKVVAEFLARLVDNETYDAAARAFVAKQRSTIQPDQLRGFLNLSLSVLSKEFKHALDLIDEDRPAEAADLFERLSRSDDPFLAVAAANLGATAMIDLEQVDRCQAMLDRVRKAHEPIERYTTASDHFRFMLGYCQVHNLAYEQAYATFEDFLKHYPNAPERLRTAATQIMTELARRAPGRLGDVRDLLDYARRRIRNGLVDDRVTERQEEAVALLDNLIEEAEEKEKNSGGGDGSGQGSGRGNSGGNQPQRGAQRSTLPSGGGRVGELRKRRAHPGEMWGRMPPRERREILQALQEQFPSQYRELLEQYYKQLAKDVRAP
ncbi:MAG: tol-pal system YbgF family protein [Phycisphaerae bacterium]